MTFGQRLKQYRKQALMTQQELAEHINVSVQAVSKWETDVGMPDISQIVPLARVLEVSSDMLLGIVGNDADAEFDAVYRSCMEMEQQDGGCWPPKIETAEKEYKQMRAFFSSYPHSAQAAVALLDLCEARFGELSLFSDQPSALEECARFASCVFRYGSDADLQARARYLYASILTRAGQKEKAEELLSAIPFRYGDRCYVSAEVSVKGGDFEKAEALCKESFSHQARFLSRTLRLMISMPNKSNEEKLAYQKYMLRLIDAFLSGGEALPYRQMYQKLTLLASMIQRLFSMGRTEDAVWYWEELNRTAEAYLAYLERGETLPCLMLLDEEPPLFGQKTDKTLCRRLMIGSVLRRVANYRETRMKDTMDEKILACEKITGTIRAKCVGEKK